ncbi:MAG TPA: TIGR00730 family Rossman fold protein [Rhabdochlamydiaceae bacterium]
MENDVSLTHDGDSWRTFRITSEFVQGFEAMMSIGPSVSFFGSARITPEDAYYKIAHDLAFKIAKKGFAIITGGGPGTMVAANQGAQAAGGKSCGLCIDLPQEEEPNLYIDRKYLLRFRYFFVRKVMFIRYAQAFVVLPGGFGTIDELFEALTLMETGKIKKFPIILIGKDYWTGLIQWMRETVEAKHHHISPEQFDLFLITDNLDTAVRAIENYYNTEKCVLNF